MQFKYWLNKSCLKINYWKLKRKRKKIYILAVQSLIPQKLGSESVQQTLVRPTLQYSGGACLLTKAALLEQVAIAFVGLEIAVETAAIKSSRELCTLN
jgi:hypothetical protein